MATMPDGGFEWAQRFETDVCDLFTCGDVADVLTLGHRHHTPAALKGVGVGADS